VCTLLLPDAVGRVETHVVCGSHAMLCHVDVLPIVLQWLWVL